MSTTTVSGDVLDAQIERVRRPKELVMPISRYNKFFDGEGSAAKAKTAMREQYGEKKGERVFYATVNEKKSQGGGRYKRRCEKE